MVIPSLEEAERRYAEGLISKQNICQIRKIYSGICRACSRKATHGRVCKVHAKRKARALPKDVHGEDRLPRMS